MDQIANIFRQEPPSTPPATGSGSRLGEAVIIVAGTQLIFNFIDQCRCILSYRNWHITILNMAPT